MDDKPKQRDKPAVRSHQCHLMVQHQVVGIKRKMLSPISHPSDYGSRWIILGVHTWPL